MNTMKMTRTTDDRPLAGATHVLAWLPSYMDPGAGRWDLQDAADYDAGAPPEGCPSIPARDLPRDADEDDVAEWVAMKLGYRVELAKAHATFALASDGRLPAAHGGREPVWYARAAHYTAPEVLTDGVRDGWADPEEDPEDVDWDARLKAAAIPYEVIDGRPVSPQGPTGIRHGRNQLGRWGEQRSADALVTATWRGIRHLLMVLRADGYGWAVPGGMIEPGEDPAAAAVRELAEETGYHADPAACRPLPARHVPDPRQSDEAWVVTSPFAIDLGDVGDLPPVAGGDDAARAAWLPAATYDHLRMRSGYLFAAHELMLRQFLASPEWQACDDLFTRHPGEARDDLDPEDRGMAITGPGGARWSLYQHNLPSGSRFYSLYRQGEASGVHVDPDPGAVLPGWVLPLLTTAAPAS